MFKMRRSHFKLGWLLCWGTLGKDGGSREEEGQADEFNKQWAWIHFILIHNTSHWFPGGPQGLQGSGRWWPGTDWCSRIFRWKRCWPHQTLGRPSQALPWEHIPCSGQQQGKNFYKSILPPSPLPVHDFVYHKSSCELGLRLWSLLGSLCCS